MEEREEREEPAQLLIAEGWSQYALNSSFGYALDNSYPVAWAERHLGEEHRSALYLG